MQGEYQYYMDDIKYPTFWEADDVSCFAHFHSSVEILYVLDGTAKAIINGDTYYAGKNQVLISSSYTAHYYSCSEKFKSIILIFPLDFVSTFNGILSKKSFSQCICKDHSINKEILHCLKQIVTFRECTSQNSTIIKGYIYVILGLLINKIELVDTEDQGNLLSKDILMYLQKNYLSPISLDTLSRDFGYSKYRFSHIFNGCFGCGFTEYVNTLRVRHAANLLITTESTLIEIAMNSGFESMRTFYRIFKEYFHVTPSQYRSSFIEQHSK